MATATELGYDDLPALLTRLTGGEKHDWSAPSTPGVRWVLHDRVLGTHERILLSKGHGPTAFYAVLAAKGVLARELLDGFGTYDSPLGHRPDRLLVPGGEIGSGSLGRGLPIAVGRALAGRSVYVLVGDGELDEGLNWEAVQYAGRVGLETLTVVVIDNDSSTYHWPGGIEQRFALEGWHAVRVDGRDHDSLEAAFGDRASGQPVCVVAEMLK